MENESWKHEVLDSLRGIRRAEPPPFLLTRIEAAIQSRAEHVTPMQWRLALVSALLLVGLNTWLLTAPNNAGREMGTSASPSYQIDQHRYDLY